MAHTPCTYEKLSIFNGICTADIHTMLACLGGYVKRLKSHEFVILEEEQVNHVGFILEGAVHMIKEDANGHKSILLHIEEGSLFGESFGVSPENPCTVSFQTAERCLILFLPFHRIFSHCSSICNFHSKLMQNVIKLIAQKNALLIEKVDITTKKNLRDKILAYLKIEGHHAKSNSFQIPLGRVELSEYLSVDRSSLTRELNHMKEDGLIDFERNRFVLR